jgi:hypothetical protein
MLAYLLNKHQHKPELLAQELLQLARQFLAEGRLAEAWKTLLMVS